MKIGKTEQVKIKTRLKDCAIGEKFYQIHPWDKAFPPKEEGLFYYTEYDSEGWGLFYFVIEEGTKTDRISYTTRTLKPNEVTPEILQVVKLEERFCSPEGTKFYARIK